MERNMVCDANAEGDPSVDNQRFPDKNRLHDRIAQHVRIVELQNMREL